MRNIFWGQIYVVQLEDYRMVKFVRRHKDPDKVILHSENPDYDDMDVDRRDILGMYLVEVILNCQIR
ncbi:MAG: S24 family peptidase [Duncaniella sp.]|nr:S24 family peptidase [Duncaniella sp.]